MAGFAVASALCDLAAGSGLLVAARVLQGLCAAAMIPQVLSQKKVMYAREERGGPMAAFAALSGLAATVGPIAGPALLEWGLWGAGWRLVFWVNIPLAVTLVAAVKLLPDGRAGAAAWLDLMGVALSAAGLLLVLYPLATAADRSGWPLWTWQCLGTGAVVLAGFVAWGPVRSPPFWKAMASRRTAGDLPPRRSRPAARARRHRSRGAVGGSGHRGIPARHSHLPGQPATVPGPRRAADCAARGAGTASGSARPAAAAPCPSGVVRSLSRVRGYCCIPVAGECREERHRTTLRQLAPEATDITSR
ncbi:MFS transporter [Actinomadura sp. NPDC049753]|uniref:MFS transporter n=1 Tax=Actinomadura sp. NPDC049753 TaxID=3154739 RepID=UPI003447E1D0